MLNQLVIARAALRPSADIIGIGRRHCAHRILVQRLWTGLVTLPQTLQSEIMAAGQTLRRAVGSSSPRTGKPGSIKPAM